MAECSPGKHKAGGSIPSTVCVGVVAQAGGLGLQGHPWVCSESQASLGYIRHCFKKKVINKLQELAKPTGAAQDAAPPPCSPSSHGLAHCCLPGLYSCEQAPSEFMGGNSSTRNKIYPTLWAEQCRVRPFSQSYLCISLLQTETIPNQSWTSSPLLPPRYHEFRGLQQPQYILIFEVASLKRVFWVIPPG